MFRACFRTVVLFFLVCPLSRTFASTKDAIVIIYAEFPGYNAHEIGTGTFIDHDGLVLTANHILHNTSMSPPAAFFNGTANDVVPTRITVYSAFLNAKFDVNPNSIVGGQIGASQWMDIALIRVSLSDTQKLQIQPLDVAQTAPAQGESLSAFGPLCVAADENCYKPGQIQTVLNSDPSLSREYQIRDIITLGYSGGPLINSSGNVVGVASWGDEIVNGQAVVRASYVPAPYVLRYFLSRIPPPSRLTAPSGCAVVHALPYLTVFDWTELSTPWLTQAALLGTADQCACCCESLDKVKNAISAPAQAGSCQPPFCAERRLYGLTNQVMLALQTNTVDGSTAEAYEAAKRTISQIDFSNLSSGDRISHYGKIASTFLDIATNANTKGATAYKDAPDIALAAVRKSNQISERAENYVEMGQLFQISGDHVNASAATVLGNVIDLPPATVRSQLKIDTERLKKSVEQGAQARIAAVPLS